MKRFANLHHKLLSGLIVLFLLCLNLSVSGQEGDGGTQNVLHEGGVSARALSLGRAFVAMADDPSAVYWNPAGLEYVPRTSFSLFHSSLVVEGASYDFAGFVYPTLQFGTVGIGYARVGVGDVTVTDVFNVEEGVLDYDFSEIYISYARRLWRGITPGITFKVNRQSVSFTGQDNSAFGLDLGIMYRPRFESGILSNTSFGFHYQNLRKPQLKLDVVEDTLATQLSFGLVKTIPVGLSGKMNLLFAYVQGEYEGAGIHSGAEYTFQNLGTLRLGYDRDKPAFGAGIIYKFLNIDYSYGNISEESAFSALHRFSVTFNFGQTREEKLLAAEEARRTRERELVERTKELERKRRIADGMKKGEEYLAEGQYFNASTEFQQVIKEDPFNKRAKALFDSAQAMIQETFEERQEEAVAQAVDKELAEDKQKRFNLYYERGNNYLQNKQFSDALIQYNLALEVRPNDSVVQEAVERTKRLLSAEIRSLVTDAREQFQQGNFSDALGVLNDARVLSNAAEVPENDALAQEIKSLTNRIELQQYFIRGLTLFQEGKFEEAAGVFEKGLELDPTNETIKKYYEQTQIELGTKRQELDPEAKRLYAEGTEHFLDGRYEKALEIWKQLAEKYPYNKEFQEIIRITEERLNSAKRQNKQ